MGGARLLLLAGAFAAYVPAGGESHLRSEPVVAATRVFYAPGADLQALDEEIIGRARRSIAMAAYVLTDRGVIAALGAAARRGVSVRLYLDGEQSARRRAGRGDPLADLVDTPGVEVRFKTRPADMHLKAYEVDGRLLRSGSANFSRSGLRQQDNDAIVIESAEAAGAFASVFEAMWARRDNKSYRPAAERRR